MWLSSWAFFRAMVEEEYRTGARVSSDGDSIVIPAVKLTLLWIVLLVTSGVVTGIVVFVRSRLGRRAG